jgi:3-hydroxybutyryl-CoA dehydrogenase
VIARLVATLADKAIQASRLPDWPGLVVLRTIAMLANEGFEAVLQGVTDEAGVDAAMRYGLNYPKGPIAWSREIGLSRVLSVLDAIHGLTGDPRYRASMALRFAAEA